MSAVSVEDRLSAAHAEVKAEIARTDTKTGLLLAFIGAVLAGVGAVAVALPLPVVSCVIGAVGVVLLVGAADALLVCTRPNLKGGHGFVRWAQLDAEGIERAMRTYRLSEDIEGLSRLARTKFAALQRSIDLTRIGGAVLTLAALIAVGGALWP